MDARVRLPLLKEAFLVRPSDRGFSAYSVCMLRLDTIRVIPHECGMDTW